MSASGTAHVRSSLAPTLCRGFRKGMVPPAVTAVQRRLALPRICRASMRDACRFLNLHEYQVSVAKHTPLLPFVFELL